MELPLESLQIEPRHLTMVLEILKQWAASQKVWAYGSRVKQNARKNSDLDLVLFATDSKTIANLKEAFAESNLPYRVDVFDWNQIPESFQKNIQEAYIVLQLG